MSAKGVLSDLQLRQWVRAGKPVAKSDGNGLTFTMSAAGHCVWVLRFRQGKRRFELTLGRFPDLGLADAREMAALKRAEIIKGTNPVVERQRFKAQIAKEWTVRQLIADYLVKKLPSFAKSTKVCYTRHLKRVEKKFGVLNVRDIEGTDIINLIEESELTWGESNLLLVTTKMYGPRKSWCILQPRTGKSTMAIRLHGSARTTPRIRAELQLATGSHRSLAKLYGLNPKTVAKWRARTSVLDEPMGPRGRASQHLSQEQEHLAIALRKQGHLSLDDLMGQLLETAPRLSRSALHRCLQRHGICLLPATLVPRRHGKFEETTLGFVHIDSAEMKISSGKQHMFVAIDRVTKFTHVAFFDRATKANTAQFLRQVLVTFPHRIHTVLTDNGMAFTGQERFRGGVTDTCIGHIFERICKFNGIEKRHTKPYHPWTNGMVERMNRTIKESTIKAYEYEGLEQLREHVQAFVQSYNFGKHLKALRWKTPFRAMCEAWEKDPSRFRLHPHHLTVGLNI